MQHSIVQSSGQEATSSVKEQRVVVRFLWAEEVKPVEIHRWMLVLYGARPMKKEWRISEYNFLKWKEHV